MPPAWWAAASSLAAALSAALVRLVPPGMGHDALPAALFLAAAAAACASAAAHRRVPAGQAAALAAGSAVTCGVAAGLLSWPSSEASWTLAAASAWLGAQVAHLTVAARTAGHPVLGAQSLPIGTVVYGASTTSCAWLDTHGGIRTWTGPPGMKGAAAALWILTREAVFSPLLQLQAPRLVSLRRMHSAEHLAVLAALQGEDPDHLDPSLDPSTPMCGGTIAAIAVPLAVTASILAPQRGAAQAMAVLWAVCFAYAVRTAALSLPRWQWLLAPGMWLQRLSTARPGQAEIRLASAAVRACMGTD